MLFLAHLISAIFGFHSALRSYLGHLISIFQTGAGLLQSRKNTSFRMMSLKQILLGSLAVLIGAWAFSACQSLDDDSNYEISTKASFFWAKNPDGSHQLDRYAEGIIEESFNLKAGIPNEELTAANMVDNVLWLANGPKKTITAVGPESGSQIQRFPYLGIEPHFFAVGANQILIADSAQGKISFVKRKNGKVQELPDVDRPGQCLYNSGKFYLVHGGQYISTYDEQAMTAISTIDAGATIDFIQFDRYKTVYASAHDSSKFYLARVSFNGMEVGDLFETNYSRLRTTPYFAATFGTEYLRSLQMVQGRLESDQAYEFARNVSDFEADFFEGWLYYRSNDTLFVKHIAQDSIHHALPYSRSLEAAFHQYADE
jgi:hypothetical protein